MTLLVKNEADIVRENIDYHLRCGASHVIATDNGSADGTREILSEYTKLGVLTLIDEPGDDYSQWRWVTRMALLARDYFDADWVLNNDADEFWWHPEKDLRVALGQTAAHILDCSRTNMVYPFDDEAEGAWHERVIYKPSSGKIIVPPKDRLGDPLEQPYFLHTLPTKVLLRTDRLITVAQGNHSAEYQGSVTRERASIKIFHFPARSAQQFESKIMQGGEAYAKNKELPHEMGWHWRRWYKMIRSAGLKVALADALPSRSSLLAGLADGTIVTDRTISAEIEQLMPQWCCRT